MATYVDLLTALNAHWAAQSGLSGSLRGPFFDEVPESEPPPDGDAPPYVVISQTGSGEESRGTRGSFIEWYVYDFKVYHYDQDTATDRAKIMADALDLFNKKPRPVFDDGSKLLSWLRESPQENKVPDSVRQGSRLMYRKSYSYRARIAGMRPGALP